MVGTKIRSQGSTKLWTAPQLHSLQSKMTTYFISGVQCFVRCFRAFKPWFVPISIKPTHQYKTVCVLFSIVCMLQLDFSHICVWEHIDIYHYICVIYFYLCVYLHLSPGHSRVVFLLGAAAWPSIDPEVITKRPTRPTLLYSDHPTTRRAIHKHKTHICNTHTTTYRHPVTHIEKITKWLTRPRNRSITSITL